MEIRTTFIWLTKRHCLAGRSKFDQYLAILMQRLTLRLSEQCAVFDKNDAL